MLKALDMARVAAHRHKMQWFPDVVASCIIYTRSYTSRSNSGQAPSKKRDNFEPMRAAPQKCCNPGILKMLPSCGLRTLDSFKSWFLNGFQRRSINDVIASLPEAANGGQNVIWVYRANHLRDHADDYWVKPS